MDWSKIKTILIYIFIFVNIFLLSVYFKDGFINKTIDDDVLNNTVEILKQNNIIINKDIIPKNYDNVKICSVENKFATISQMLKDVEENNNSELFNSNNTEITGNRFVCEGEALQSKEIKNPEKFLQETGLISSGAYKKTEKNGYTYFYLRFEDKVFFDSYIRIKQTENGIEEISGKNWLGDRVSEEGVSEVVSPAEILINFSAQNKSSERITVQSMTSGYYIGIRSETVMATASPVWEICLSNGRKVYYDMRNGDLLE